MIMRFLFRAPVFLAFPPPPPFLLFAINMPRRLAAVADALLGMVNSDLLLLLPSDNAVIVPRPILFSLYFLTSQAGP
jgi:hypothetical protein